MDEHSHSLCCRGRKLSLVGRGCLMGIVNATPDSFFDGGEHDDVASAVSYGLRLLEEGADILDIGGESTRPGSVPVDAAEEISRVIPVVRELRGRTNAIISVDTMKGEVAKAAFDAGADMLNDVTGMTRDFAGKCGALKAFGAGCVVMHWQQRPAGVSDDRYVDWVVQWLCGQLGRIMDTTGLDAAHFLVDPGIGFGKTDWENLELLRHLDDFHATGCPVLLGISRKSVLQRSTGCLSPSECLAGTAGATAVGAWLGADVHRVHDVRAMRDVLAVVDAVKRHATKDEKSKCD